MPAYRCQEPRHGSTWYGDLTDFTVTLGDVHILIDLNSQNDLLKQALLIRPCEVSSRITHTAVLKVADHALWSSFQHEHVLVGCVS